MRIRQPNQVILSQYNLISISIWHLNWLITKGIGIRETVCADAETTATINNVPPGSTLTKKSASMNLE